ncbi:hypothetical protein NMY22_g9456 [Coprinellus aureogranulatus]|nr:hypothetical protein NMY22_g9456 [Coprinellus aureogranulatus]
MKKSFRDFIRDQCTTPPPVATADLSGQTVIVTGANAGLGFEAAKHFANMKPGKLILACRSFERGSAAVASIKEATGFKNVELWLLDLANFSSIIAFADRFKNEGGRLDILVANAAIAVDKYKLTADGWEESLQVNDLSTSLLCFLLAPRLVETAREHGSRPRVTIVSSEVHYWVTFPEKTWEVESAFQYLNSMEHCTPKRMGNRYFETKLLNIFFTRSFADLLKKTPVIFNTVNPGFCISEIRKKFTGMANLVNMILEKTLARPTEAGARQLVYAAIGNSEDAGSLHGHRKG